MESLPVPKTIKVYQLLKMTTKGSLSINTAGAATSGAGYIGHGMYLTLNEAEQNRTLETLKDLDGSNFHIFELDFPNPAYKE
jgi:hypothetical protein